MKKTLLLVVAILTLNLSVFGQNDPVLFTVSGAPVHLSEFNYIYSKTNGTKADYSKASVDEYLDLYTKFKMKVAKARDMKLDTLPALKEELGGYRRQLADSYLTDREVTDKLVKEAFDRSQKDINISHILIRSTKEDADAAMTKAKAAKTQLDKGIAFEKVAAELSEDPNSKDKGGMIGFLTAMLPNGFYELENAIYKTAVGKYSDIVSSPLGLHIIKVNSERPARGEMEIAHILLRKKKEGVEQPWAKSRIDSLYSVLQKGGSFDDLATNFSDDDYSKPRKGYLGFFGIGRYELAFEDAAFALTKDGEYTKVIESTIGYHIIKRISRKSSEPFDLMKNRLKGRITQDGRFELSKKAMVERIKKESKFGVEVDALDKYIASLDSTFLTYSWRVDEKSKGSKMFAYGKKESTTTDFANYLANNANRRLSYAVTMNNKIADISKTMYQEFIDEQSLVYEETQLEAKYPDFKNLMREYEEGILLFEAIKINVWDKASQDSTGLEKFYETKKSKYVWEDRYQVLYYSLTDSAKAELENIRQFAAKNKVDDVVKKFNLKGDVLSFREEVYEKSKLPLNVKNMREGGVTPSEQNTADKTWSFIKVEKMIPATTKSLREARGYAVAEYQEFLEKQWIEELAKKYKLVVNKDVLKSIVK
jgi:peptidyl-prolyl cis-trans isomerase SurA